MEGIKDSRKLLRDARAASDTESKTREKKHKKREKKKKSKKKRKKSRKSESEDSSSCSSSSSDEWTEKGGRAVDIPAPMAGISGKETAERDEWMSLPGLFPSVTKERKQPQKREDTEKMMLDTLGQSKYELNPYWKGGGTGLPSEDKPGAAAAGTVGDLGADWLRRALTRAREQAREEGRPLEEVAAERWGSLAKLESMLAAAEAKSGSNARQARGCQPRGANSFNSRGRGSYGGDWGSRGMERDERRRDDRGDRSRDDGEGREDRGRRETGRGEDRAGMFRKPRRDSDEEDDKPAGSGSRFRKPDEDSSKEYRRRDNYSSSRRTESSWRKKEFVESKRESPRKSKSPDSERNRVRSPRNDRRTSPERKPEAPPDTISATSEAPSDRLRTAPTASGSAGSKVLPERNRAPSTAVTARGSSSDEEPVEAPEVNAALTDKELNELGAKLVKAEILGNETLAAELRGKLDAARTARSTAPARPPARTARETEVVILTRTDARGMVRPVSSVSDPWGGGGGGRRKKGKVETHDRDGQRVRYFPDDDDRSLKDMFESEKLSTVEDSNKMFSDMAGKVKPNDDMADIFEDAARRQPSTAAARAARDRSLAVGEARQSGRALDTCPLCMDSKRSLKHLVVAIGTKSYLSLPPQQSLTDGHCFIVPLNHSPCGTQLDEDVWAEMKTFRTALTSMFLKMDQDVVYLETAMNLRKFPHAFIECIPMPTETGHMAPIYFKKAIQECETEWSTNKKLVDTSVKDVRRSVPRGLPYFSVDFGNDGGFAHVIEDEAVFPRNFAQEIVGGMLDLDHRLWRKPQRDSFESQRKKVLEFAEWWKPYDFTRGGKTNSDSDSDSD